MSIDEGLLAWIQEALEPAGQVSLRKNDQVARVTFKDGRVDTMNDRRALADVHDDAEAMRRRAALAVEAGLRGASRKRKR